MPAAAPVGSADGRESSWVSIIGHLECGKRCRFRTGSPNARCRNSARALKEIGGIENGTERYGQTRFPPAAEALLELESLILPRARCEGRSAITKSRATVQERASRCKKVYEK